MTVVLEVSRQNWLGLSTDTKPSAPPVGSTFYETDSGALYIYDGAAWKLRRDAGSFFISKTITFDGTANKGAVGNVPLFTVTGEVLMIILVPFCTTLLTEAVAGATLALGVTGATALFIAATPAVDIDANEFWVDTAPDPNGVAVPAALKDIAITDNIVGTVAVQAINGGVVRLDLLWIPLSSNGLVVAA